MRRSEAWCSLWTNNREGKRETKGHDCAKKASTKVELRVN